MNYKLNLKALDSSFKVPNALADNFIKLANPKHILILLWVLRHADTPKSSEEICAELHMDKSIVNEAIFYWIDNGFMVPTGAAEQPDMPDTTAAAQSRNMPREQASPTPQPAAAKPEHPLGSSMADDADILARAQESAEFKFLLQKSQQIFGRTISKAERSMLLSLMDYYGLPCEVILMLIKYAVLSGRTGTRYIQTVGAAWAEEGIQTLEQAEAKIKQLNKTNKLWRTFSEQAGIAYKNPTKKQEALFVKWTKEWKMSVEMLAYAYEKMLDSIDKVNYNYLDKIITSWHDAGLKSISQVEQAEAGRKEQAAGKQKEAASTPSFSIDKYNRFVDNFELKYKKENQDV
ncbi:MAG: DnaD domain protein [Clostridia bacterium]|nr:DnaD domain protein [Clostridia bacterium]